MEATLRRPSRLSFPSRPSFSSHPSCYRRIQDSRIRGTSKIRGVQKIGNPWFSGSSNGVTGVRNPEIQESRRRGMEESSHVEIGAFAKRGIDEAGHGGNEKSTNPVIEDSTNG